VVVDERVGIRRARRRTLGYGTGQTAGRRIAGQRPQQIDAEHVQNLAREWIAGFGADDERVFDRGTGVLHARHFLHAQDRRLIETTSHTEYLKIDFARDDVNR